MFNHTTLEADIERLSKAVAEKRNMPEHKDLLDKEIIRRVIEPAIKNKLSQAAPSAIADLSDDNPFLPNYLGTASDDIRLRVEELIDIVFHKGLSDALSRAQAFKNPFILDAFHDALTDKLYEELQKRNLI